MIVFLIVLVFLIVATVVMFCGFGSTPEYFKDIRVPAEFYPQPKLTEFEKINSLYSPFIIRPPDIISRNSCGDPTKTGDLYTTTKGAFPCKTEVEGKYYAMRPILNPDTYQEMISILLESCVDKEDFDQTKYKYPNEFSTGDSYTNVMRFILDKLNKSKTQLEIFKEYAKNDTWGGEQFAYLNEKVFAFTESPPEGSQQQQAIDARKSSKIPTKYVISFTLHNTLRSSSIDIVAIVFFDGKKYHLVYINFATESPQNEGITSFSFGNFKSGSVSGPNKEYELEQSTPQWIYGNTIENKTFNLKGFHDPDGKHNFLIPGGVPEEYNDVLEKCDQGYLLNPANSVGDRFEGGYQSNSSVQSPNVYPDYPNKTQKWSVYN